MKGLIAFIIVLMHLTALGQNRLSFGVNFTPVFSKNIYQGVTDSENFKGVLDFNQYDQWSFGWISGISAEYNLKERVFLSLELDYKRIHDIYYNGLPIYYSFEDPDGFVFVPFYHSNATQNKSDLNFIVLPIGIKYKLIKLSDKLEIFLHPSVSPELLLNSNPSENQFTTEHSKVNMVFKIGLPFKFFLNEEISMILSPQYGHSMNQINHIKFNSNEFLNQWNKFFGIQMELMYKQK